MPITMDLHCIVIDDVNEMESTGPNVVLVQISGFTKIWLAWWRTDLANIVSARAATPTSIRACETGICAWHFRATRHRFS